MPSLALFHKADWETRLTGHSLRRLIQLKEKNDSLKMTARWFSYRRLPSWGIFEGHCGAWPILTSIAYERNLGWELTWTFCKHSCYIHLDLAIFSWGPAEEKGCTWGLCLVLLWTLLTASVGQQGGGGCFKVTLEEKRLHVVRFILDESQVTWNICCSPSGVPACSLSIMETC